MSLSFATRSIFRLGCLGIFCALYLAGLPLWAITVSPSEKGVRIDAGSMGAFVLSYPAFVNQEQKSPQKITSTSVDGKNATVTYDGGTILKVATTDTEISFTVTGVPEGIKLIKESMFIDVSYQQGGRWKFGSKEGNFPAEKPTKPQLYQGSAAAFELTNAEGKKLSLKIPGYGYQELVDNRAWGASIYNLQLLYPYNPNLKTYKITVGNGGAIGGDGTKVTPLVDAFGQMKAGDWPDKVKSEDDLKTDVASEKSYYDGLTVPVGDKYGGLPDSKDKLGLTASGFFHVEKKGDKWILVDPDGNAFFHLGLCAFAPGDDYTWVGGRESIYEWLPELESEYKTAYRPQSGNDVFSFHLANMIRKYGVPYSLDDFQSRMIDRVRKFGFNSIGAFSPVADTVVQAKNFPYVLSLQLDPYGGKIKNIPGISQTWDPFDESNRAQVDKNFAMGVASKANDPLLIGYFLANEPLYEDIPKVVPSLKGTTWACKRALVQLLTDKYKTIDAFNKAWGTTFPSLDALSDAPLSVTTQDAYEDMHAYSGLFFETYFKLVADTFHKYDSHHMLIGNRLQPGTINNEQLCHIAGTYLDVMSFNYYTNGVDKDFLNRIYKWTGGRPMFLSEFYWASPRESGLVGGNEVTTEQARGEAYRNYLEQGASLGYVVGIEWFTLVDQASTGRWFSKYSGERANSGLFSVTDRPYKPALEEMKKSNEDVYKVWLEAKAPYSFDDPKFAQASDAKNVASAPRSTGPIKMDGTTANWPGIPANVVSGKRLVVGSEAGDLEGTFKLCWDDQNLYLLAIVADSTPLMSKLEPKDLWRGDGLEIFIGSEKLDEGGPLIFSDRHLIVGAPAAGKAPIYYGNSPTQYATEAVIVPGGDGKSYTIEVAIPWETIGIKPKVGSEILFDLGINDSTTGTDRRAQLMWNGTQKNSTDRTHWGRVTLRE